MRALLSRSAFVLGCAWVGVVVAFGAYLGFMGMFFRAPGLLNQEGYGDIYLLMVIAAPGLGLIWLGKRFK